MSAYYNNQENEAYLNHTIRNILTEEYRNREALPKNASYYFRIRLNSEQAESKRCAASRYFGIEVPVYVVCKFTENFPPGAINLIRQSEPHNANTETENYEFHGDWYDLLYKLTNIGVYFSLIEGEEQLRDKPLLKKISGIKEMLNVFFVDWKAVDERALQFLDAQRNMFPLLKLDYKDAATENGDFFRQYDALLGNLKKLGIIYGCSVGVDKENADSTASEEFAGELKRRGFKLLFFRNTTDKLKEDGEFKEKMYKKIELLRSHYPDLIIYYYP